MFIGIDHGTTAMRFAGESGKFKISREAAKEFSIEDLSRLCPLDEIEGIALCYSMGDNYLFHHQYYQSEKPGAHKPGRGRTAYRRRDQGI